MTVCPNCGRALATVTLGADTPPWLCQQCARGWWNAELDAQASWNPLVRDFGDQTWTVLAAVDQERAASDV